MWDTRDTSAGNIKNTALAMNDVSPRSDETDDVEAPKKAFRLSAKKFFVTYPQSGALTKEQVLNKIRSIGFVIKYIICTEHHQEEGVHIHAAFEYQDKVNWKSPDKLDINGHHPNIQTMKSWKSSEIYLKKEQTGDFITGASFDDATHEKFVARKADYDAWTAHNEQKALGEIIYPVILPNGWPWTPTGKKRHLWIIGKPDWGKSLWAMTYFSGKKVFMRRDTGYPYEGYAGETVVILDDVYPKQEEWLNVSNWHWNNMHVYGPVRYKPIYWANNVNVSMIVLTNNMPSYVNMEAFDARFNIIQLE
nr:MAG: replication associated protein [Cressdnaviricota sp.]